MENEEEPPLSPEERQKIEEEIAGLSDVGLVKMINSSGDYVREAVNIAYAEMDRRGGRKALVSRMTDEERHEAREFTAVELVPGCLVFLLSIATILLVAWRLGAWLWPFLAPGDAWFHLWQFVAILAVIPLAAGVLVFLLCQKILAYFGINV